MRQKLSVKDKSVYSIVSFIVGFLVCLSFISFISKNTSFWNVRFVEIMRLVMMLLIAFFISHYVAMKNNKKTKFKDLCDKFLNNIYTDILTMNHDVINFMETSKISDAKNIALHFKSLAPKLKQLKINIDNKTISEKINRIEESMNKVQDIVQNDTWGMDKIEYSIDNKDNVKRELTTSINYLTESIFLNYK